MRKTRDRELDGETGMEREPLVKRMEDMDEKMKDMDRKLEDGGNGQEAEKDGRHEQKPGELDGETRMEMETLVKRMEDMDRKLERIDGMVSLLVEANTRVPPPHIPTETEDIWTIFIVERI